MVKGPEKIRKDIEGLSSLPTIPPVVTKILRLLDTDEISIQRIGEFISNDQSLSARVLKIINSPVYGFPCRISSVSQAIMLLGLGALKGMLLSVSIFDIMEKAMIGLWEHSFGTAMAARLIAIKKNYRDVEDASVAGLIHDLGKVALSLCYPEQYEQVITQAREKEDYLMVFEREIIGTTHDMAGLWISKKWNFPLQLVETIGYHHNPCKAREHRLLTSIVHLSDIMIKMMGFGFSGDPFVYPVEKEAWGMLGFNRKDLLELFQKLEKGLSENEGFIF
jgi:HD-like signal output (HDOD) protein